MKVKFWGGVGGVGWLPEALNISPADVEQWRPALLLITASILSPFFSPFSVFSVLCFLLALFLTLSTFFFGLSNFLVSINHTSRILVHTTLFLCFLGLCQEIHFLLADCKHKGTNLNEWKQNFFIFPLTQCATEQFTRKHTHTHTHT